MRLLLSGRNLVRNGEPIIRFEGAERDRLLSIRDGAWSFDDIMALSDSLQAGIRGGLEACPLPPEPDLPATRPCRGRGGRGRLRAMTPRSS